MVQHKMPILQFITIPQLVKKGNINLLNFPFHMEVSPHFGRKHIRSAAGDSHLTALFAQPLARAGVQ